jgi:hypothetical protein
VVWAASNLKRIYTLPVNQLNAEALLARETLIMTVEAAKWAEEALAVEPHGRRGRKFAAAPESDAVEEPDAEEPVAEAVDELADEEAAAEDEVTVVEETEALAEESQEEAQAEEQSPAAATDGDAEDEA